MFCMDLLFKKYKPLFHVNNVCEYSLQLSSHLQITYVNGSLLFTQLDNISKYSSKFIV